MAYRTKPQAMKAAKSFVKSKGYGYSVHGSKIPADKIRYQPIRTVDGWTVKGIRRM